MSINILAALNDPNISFFFRFLNLIFKEANFKQEGTQITLKWFSSNWFFFDVHLMRWMRCTDKAVGCNSHTKIKIIKIENNRGVINPL